MKVTVKINKNLTSQIFKKTNKALFKTAEAIRGDLQDSQTMPLDTGNLQNKSTFVYPRSYTQIKNGEASIVSDTPYARRLYHHPEYNFKRDKNPYAGGKWFEPYISGNKKTLVQEYFEEFMKEEG